jgi:hypothetical protein
MNSRSKRGRVSLSNTHKTRAAARSKAPALTVRTLTGRQIPAPPRPRVSSAAVAKRDRLSLQVWLVQQAQAEAQATGDDFMQTLFRGLNPRNFSNADAAGCNLYLFGQTHPEFDARTGELLKPE